MSVSETAGMNLVVPVVHPDHAQHRRLIANSLNQVVMEHGLPPRYNTLQLAVTRDDVSGPGLTSIASTGVKVMGFSPTDNEYVHFTGIIPHGYVEGTPFRINVRWTPTDSAEGVVVWRVTFFMTALNVPLMRSPNPQGAAREATADGVLSTRMCVLGSVSGAARASAMIIGTLSRNANESGDTYPGDAGLISVDLLYQSDAKGSQDAYTKYVVRDGG